MVGMIHRSTLFSCWLLSGIYATTHLRRRAKSDSTVRNYETGSSTESDWNVDDDDDAFTIIFVSDLENKYRGHDILRSKYVVNYIRDLKDKNIPFDGNYSNKIIDPKLVIHGGDISHMWSCDNFEWFVLGGCRDPDDEYKDVWDSLYDAGIPMISAFGNHDWKALNGTGNPWGGDELPTEPRNEEADYINNWSNEFVRKSYEKTKKLGNGNFQYEEIRPTGRFGQSMFRATFAGTQIANFNAAFHWQSYDDDGVYSSEDQFNRFSATLDRSMKTLFFSHYPLNNYGFVIPEKPTIEDAKSLIREFGPNTHHFSGHLHRQIIRTYNDAEPNFNDYVASYPHTWVEGEDPGFYAVLMSPSKGILQVKVVYIPGLEAGERCLALGYLNSREYFFGFRSEKDGLSQKQEGRNHSAEADNEVSERLDDILGRDLGCWTCKSGKKTWSRQRHCFVC